MPPTREFEAGPLIAAGGAVVLLVSLFLDWFDEFTAWTAFEALDLALAGLAAAAIAAALLPSRVPSQYVPVLGAAAFVIVASQLISHPPVGIDRSTSVGAWIGFGGSIAMLAGGAVAVARVSLAVAVNERPRSGHTPPTGTPVPPPPPAPAPPPAPGPEDETHRLGG